MSTLPERFDPLYDILPDGTMHTVQFLEEFVAPGASLPSWKLRDMKHTFVSSPTHYCRTKREAYLRFSEELRSGIQAGHRSIEEIRQEIKRQEDLLADTQRILQELD